MNEDEDQSREQKKKKRQRNKDEATLLLTNQYIQPNQLKKPVQQTKNIKIIRQIQEMISMLNQSHKQKLQILKMLCKEFSISLSTFYKYDKQIEEGKTFNFDFEKHGQQKLAFLAKYNKISTKAIQNFIKEQQEQDLNQLDANEAFQCIKKSQLESDHEDCCFNNPSISINKQDKIEEIMQLVKGKQQTLQHIFSF